MENIILKAQEVEEIDEFYVYKGVCLSIDWNHTVHWLCLEIIDLYEYIFRFDISMMNSIEMGNGQKFEYFFRYFHQHLSTKSFLNHEKLKELESLSMFSQYIVIERVISKSMNSSWVFQASLFQILYIFQKYLLIFLVKFALFDNF